MSAGTRSFTVFTVATVVSLVFAGGVAAQGHPGLVALSVGSGSSLTDIEEAEALIRGMTRSGQLVLQASHADSQFLGRQHEGFGQYFNGVPVHGASISRQTEAGTTVSIFGTVYTDIEINPIPTLSLGDASTLIAQSFGATALQVVQPLTVLPTLDGGYALAYRITASNAVTYFVDAHDGQVLMKVDEKRSQSAVGQGSGVLGDVKKISATRVGGIFEARDQLRPATILTLNVEGDMQSLDRLIEGGRVLKRDIATDQDNNWTGEGGIVDTHVHMGWTYDYFFKRHSWAGLDGLNAELYGVRVSSAFFNAAFVPPPFGPNGRGISIFGTTPAGTPLTTLDIVAHELMHGVTEFGVGRRNPRGLEGGLRLDGLGPTSAFIDGQSRQCSNLALADSDGTQFPFFCSAGRFVLVSNPGGATHEAFSDVFGTSTEFFFQAPGGGYLRADYLLGEDIPEMGLVLRGKSGPTRSLRRPSSLFVDTTMTARFPAHYSRRLRFALVEVEGYLFVVPLAFNGNKFFWLNGTDYGGVHWNSTILSHAFYLAIEGGRHNTSGIRVDGVDGANRSQIERVFFRAVTELMPGDAPLPVVADVICQAAADLFGHASFAAMAVEKALYAVGLRPPPTPF